jgi:phenylacetate-CoA ligase
MTEFSFYRMTEFLHLDEIKKVQEQLFKLHMTHLVANSPYYQDALGISRDDSMAIGLADLKSLPFTDKTIFSERNDDFLAVPMSRVVDIVLSSGTTGQPARIMYTENDLERLAYNEELSMAGCGLTSDDIVLLTCTMDRCFIAGLAYFSGVRQIGAAAIRNGLSSFESHLLIIQRMRPTAIIGVPTLLLKLGQFLASNGVNPQETGVARLICIGEPVRDRGLSLLKIGEDIEALWGAKAFSTYASSETITSFCECGFQNGGHLHPELAIVEIVDENGAVLPDGEVGEVVITPLLIEGMPLLRYRTGDISFLREGLCECGRRTPRLGPILGRKKQMMKFRGTTIYPNAIYAVLDEMPEISEYCIEVSSDFDLSDNVRVLVCLRNGRGPSPDFSALIGEKLQARLRVRPEIVMTSEERIKTMICPERSRKINRFIDRRKTRVDMS